MTVKELRSFIKNVPDDFEFQVWDEGEGEWKSDIEGFIQLVKVFEE